MANILVVDDAASIVLLVEKILTKAGFTVRPAGAPAEALEQAVQARPDLVVSDINMPGMSGLTFREELRKLPGCDEVPFVFMSAADPSVELEIARSLRGDRLVFKPLHQAELVRVVNVALGTARSERGAMPEILDRILRHIDRDQETGVLTAVDGATVKRFAFQKGKLVFSASNDPRDLIGQALLKAGVITEEDLLAAFAREGGGEAPEAGKPRLASALAALRKVTPEQCEKVFLSKVRESLLDLFLWEEGQAEFLAGAVEGEEMPYPVSLDLGPLRAEGARRRSRWSEIGAVLPGPDRKLAIAGPWPAGFPANAGDRLLARALSRGLSFGEILVELRGQRYAVGSKVVELIRSGALAPGEETGFSASPPDQPSPEELERARLELEEEERVQRVQSGHLPEEVSGKVPAVPSGEIPVAPEPAEGTAEILAQGLIRMRAGDLAGAREVFLDVLQIDPFSALARSRLEEVEGALAAASGLLPEAKLSLVRPIQELAGKSLSPGDAFVLSRLAGGPRTLHDLVVLCPMPEPEVRGIVDRFVAEGIVKRL